MKYTIPPPTTKIFGANTPETSILNSYIPRTIQRKIEFINERNWSVTIHRNAYGQPSTALCEMVGTPVRAKIVVDIYHAPATNGAIIIHQNRPYPVEKDTTDLIKTLRPLIHNIA